MEHMIIKEARRSWIRLAILAATLALLAVLGAAASPAHAAYDYESTTNPDNARDYAEVILNDNGFGHADTYINLSEADRSGDGMIYVRYTQNACRYQDLRVELLGDLPKSWNRVDLDPYAVRIKSELEQDCGWSYDTISVNNEEKVAEETLSIFYDDPTEGYLTRDNVIRIDSFVDKDDNYNMITGGASLRITLNPTKTMQNCQIELDKKIYGYEDTPEPTVTWLGTKLTKGKDYEIDEVYTNAGSEQSYITLKGIGDFANSDYYLLMKSVDYKVDWEKEHITDDSDDPDNPVLPGDPSDEDYVDPVMWICGQPLVNRVEPYIGEDWFGDPEYGEPEYRVVKENLPAGMTIRFEDPQKEDDPTRCIMTLDGCTIDARGEIPKVDGLWSPPAYITSIEGLDPNLVLKGSNVMKGGAATEMVGLYSTEMLNISGTGSLTIDMAGARQAARGIEGGKGVTIDGSTLSIKGSEQAASGVTGHFYGITRTAWNFSDEDYDGTVAIRNANVAISNTSAKSSKAWNFGIDSQDNDLTIENSTVQITMTGGDAAGIGSGLYSDYYGIVGGELSVDDKSLVTIKLLNRNPEIKDEPYSAYFFENAIRSPKIYTGDPGTAAKLTGASSFSKHIDRYECYHYFLEFAPSERSHANPVLPAVSKKANPMTVKAKTVTGKAKKNTTIAAAKAFTVKNNVGKVTYKKTSGDNKITVAKTGKVTVKKGLKKNKTYTVKVKVTDPGDQYYKSGSKTVSLKVTIK